MRQTSSSEHTTVQSPIETIRRTQLPPAILYGRSKEKRNQFINNATNKQKEPEKKSRLTNHHFDQLAAHFRLLGGFWKCSMLMRVCVLSVAQQEKSRFNKKVLEKKKQIPRWKVNSTNNGTKEQDSGSGCGCGLLLNMNLQTREQRTMF